MTGAELLVLGERRTAADDGLDFFGVIRCDGLPALCKGEGTRGFLEEGVNAGDVRAFEGVDLLLDGDPVNAGTLLTRGITAVDISNGAFASEEVLLAVCRHMAASAKSGHKARKSLLQPNSLAKLQAPSSESVCGQNDVVMGISER
jgi:hypothetical protein